MWTTSPTTSPEAASRLRPGTLTCSVGDIKANQTKSFKIKVHIHPDLVSNNGGPLTIFNTATVASNTPDDDLSDNTDTEGTIVEDKADLEVTKMCKPDDFLAAGKTGPCTIFIDNHGPSYARSVTLTDVILSDGSFTVGTITPSQGSCNSVTNVSGGKKFVCNLGTLANASPSTEGRATVYFEFSATEAMDINNLATVTAATPDPDTRTTRPGVRRGDGRDRPRDRQDRTGQRHRGDQSDVHHHDHQRRAVDGDRREDRGQRPGRHRGALGDRVQRRDLQRRRPG